MSQQFRDIRVGFAWIATIVCDVAVGDASNQK